MERGLSTFDFTITAMRLFGGTIALCSLPIAWLAVFAIVQPVISWFNPQYKPVVYLVEDKVASAWGGFLSTGSISFMMIVIAAILLLPTFNFSFRTWLHRLSENIASKEKGQGEKVQ